MIPPVRWLRSISVGGWREETGDILKVMIAGLDPLESEDLEKGYQKKMMTFKLILIGLRF